MTLSSSVCSLVAALAVIVLALNAQHGERKTDTFVLGCDRFGYEHMAGVVRAARATGTKPDYFLHDEQTRRLIGMFKASGLPVPAWDEIVTTHAHHYFPGSDQVGPQYPPGTGRILSMFPAANDVKALDRLTILLTTAGALGMIAWCAWRGLAASSLVLAGSAATLFSPYGWILSSSYSINATILPLFAGTLLAWAATRTRRRLVSMVLGLGAGLLFGLLIQIRLASALLVPAAALLFVPRRLHVLPGYAAGVFFTGILPVLLQNRTVTGHLFGATYNGADRSQALGCIADNVRFYFGRFVYESGCLHVLGLVVVLVLWLAVTAAMRPPGAAPAWRTWLAANYGLLAAPLCAGGLSVAYFLTHVMAISYYLVPAMLLTGLLLGLLSISLEMHWLETAGDFVVAGTLRTGLAVTAAAAALVTAVVDHRAAGRLVRAALPAHDEPPPKLAVPAVLMDPRAWIWGDLYSSSILYYTGHPAFKISFATPKTRLLLYGWIQTRGDPQYLVADSDDIKPLVDEARAAGWRLTPVGMVHDAVCYKMEAP